MKIKKLISIILCLSMLGTAVSCSKESKEKSTAENTGSSIAGTVSNASDGKNKITRYYDEYMIGDGNLKGFFPADICGNSVYYIKDKYYDYDSESEQTSGYTVDLRTFSVEPDGTGSFSGGMTVYSNEKRTVYCPDDRNVLIIRDLLSGDEKKTELTGGPLYSGYDTKGNVYLYIKGSLYVYGSDGELLDTYPVYDQLEDAGMGGRFIYDMCVSAEGKVYFAVSKKGEYHSICTLDEKGKLKNITGNITDLNDNVSGCYMDRDGNIVLCTGYGNCFADVISAESGETVRRYELYGVYHLIGPSENSDMIYVRSDGIYSYDYLEDASEIILSDETLPQLANSFRSAVICGNVMSLRLATYDRSGCIAVYNTETGQTDYLEAPFCSCGTADEAGNFYFVTDELSLDGDENGSYETVRNTVYQMDGDGNVKMLFMLPQFHSEVYVESIETDSNGNFVFLYPGEDDDCRASVYVADKTGNIVKTISPENENDYIGFSSLFKNSVGDIMVSYISGEVFRIDNNTYELEKTDFSVDSYLNFYSSSGEYDYFYSTPSGVYGYAASENRSDEIVMWAETDSQINQSNKAVFLSPEIILAENGIKLVKADEKRLEELNSREIITLAVSGTEVKQFAEYFNRTNDKYRIYMKDYSKYGTGDYGFSSGKDSEQLAKDIIDGDIPDIIMLDDMHLSEYILKGIFADFKEFIDKDEDMDISDFDEKVMDEFTYKGSLYTIPAVFSSKTLLSADGQTDWNYSDFISYSEKNEHAFNSYTGSSLSYFLITDFLHDYIDLESGKCDIDNDEFRNIIRFIKDNISEYDDYEIEEDPYEYAQNNVIYETHIESVTDFNLETGYTEWRRETPYVAGYPGTDGGKRYIYPIFSFAVTKQSEVKDGAWEFIRMFLNSGFRETADDIYSGISLRDLLISNKKVREKEINSSENILNAFESVPYSDEIKNAFRDYLNMPVFSDLEYKGIEKIVFDELADYYSGAVSEEEVSKTVQSKISLYLNEVL